MIRFEIIECLYAFRDAWKRNEQDEINSAEDALLMLFDEQEQNIAELESQRDALLSACEAVMRAFTAQLQCDAYDLCEAAIAKAKGTENDTRRV